MDFCLIVNHLDGEIPVKVEFRLEGQRYRHEPGQFRFREKWLIGGFQLLDLIITELKSNMTC